MKKIKTLSFLVCTQLFFAQLGINTDVPSRMLHVKGNVKISTIKDASEDAAFDRVLVADQDGNVDYINKQDFLPNPGVGHSDKEAHNAIYNMASGVGDPNKVLKCGKFGFVFGATEASEIMFFLQERPASNVNIYMNMEQNWDGGGFQFFQGTAGNNTLPFLFTPTNYNVPRLFTSANVADFEQNVMHFQYPGDDNLYRLTIYRVMHSGTSYDFVAACEKF